MSKNYYIIEIKGCTDSLFGDCAVVLANPIKEIKMGTYSSQSVTPCVCAETKRFFFPDDDYILEPLLRFARNQSPWTPDFDYFNEERIFDEDTNKHIVIYRHHSFWEDVPSATENSAPIRISSEKQCILSRRYQDYMRQNYMIDPIDLQEYVGRLCDNDPNFFAWIFDDSSLRGCSVYELDDEYQEAWQHFYDRCDPYFNRDEDEY